MSSGFLVCSSLRRRSDWALLPSALLSSKPARWRETRLDTHDVALPLPLPPIAAAAAAAAAMAPPPSRVLRVIFLAPGDVGTEATRGRLERLYHLNGGEDVVVVFLLKEEKGRESPTATLMRIQLDLIGGFEMPVIPVVSVGAVPATLLTFHRRLSTSVSEPKPANPAQSLLPHCTNGRALSEHAVNVLTDVTTGFQDMVEKVSSSAGREELKEYLDEDAEKLISFWTSESIVE